MKVNEERLADVFTRLCETDSPSWREGKIAALLKTIFSELQADEIIEDKTAQATGSDTGNLFIRFAGTRESEGIFLNCHMDTVQPCEGVKVQRNGNIFTSSGDTILGSDDKSGIAAIIEAVSCLRDNNIDHPPFEIILTTCEEVGLLGAKSLDPGMIRTKMGYALDSTGFGTIITGAPAANHLQINIRGTAAHAGLHPELGISAIKLAAEALTRSPHGRIDAQSTANFGTIKGGTASNIVPEEVEIIGEVRSHSLKKLEELTKDIKKAFTSVIKDWRDESGHARGKPQLRFQANSDFPLMSLHPTDPVVVRIEKAARSVGIDLEHKIAGGGSDANILNGYGLQTAIVATGMTHVHSTDEQVDLNDMIALTKLILALITSDHNDRSQDQ